MRKDYMEWTYETMACGITEAYRMPGVEHAFSKDDVCMKRYGDAIDAYERLCQCLGVTDEDEVTWTLPLKRSGQCPYWTVLYL